MKLTPLQMFYAACAALGLLWTGWHNWRFVQDTGGFSIALFMTTATPTHSAASLVADLTVCFLACVVWMLAEGRRVGMKGAWVFVALSTVVALAVGLPLFLLFRDRKLAGAS